MNYYDVQVETLDRDGLRRLQNDKLRALTSKLSTNQFYQEKARSAGMNIGDVHTVDDLGRLPFTTKDELVAQQRDSPPFGKLLTYPITEYRYFHQTSGTGGRPLRWLDTEEAWAWWARCWGYVFRAAGVTSNDVVFCAFSFGPYLSHWAAMHGGWHIGAMCISGGGMDSVQRLRALMDNRCTVLVCTPTYALHLAEVAKSEEIDLRESRIRITIHAGEPGASLPNVRQAIESAWGAQCFDHAGATEAGAWGIDCEGRAGAIHLNEAEFVFEVIDPDTTQPVSEGRRGELVVTNLGRAGMPLLRYRSGDLVQTTGDPCPCGRGFTRIKGGVLGRADDMIIVRGVNLYPAPIDNLIRGLPGIIEYEVEIRSGEGMDDLLIRVEADDITAAIDAVVHAFRREFNIRVTVETAPVGSLPRYEFKARRFKRLR